MQLIYTTSAIFASNIYTFLIWNNKLYFIADIPTESNIQITHDKVT